MARLVTFLFAQQILVLGGTVFAAAAVDSDPGLRFAATLPASATDIPRTNPDQVASAAAGVADWAGDLVWQTSPDDAPATFRCVVRLVEAKQLADRCLERILGLRGHLATGASEEGQRQVLRTYLAIAAQCIDLSGRLRYVLYNAVNRAAYARNGQPDQLLELIAVLTRNRVSVGANVMIDALFDPPPETQLAPYPTAMKLKVLDLLAAAGTAEVLPDLADFVRHTQDELLLVRAIEIIRQIGLPEPPRPQQDPEVPPPPIAAEELRVRLASAPHGGALAGVEQRRAGLAGVARTVRPTGSQRRGFPRERLRRPTR